MRIIFQNHLILSVCAFRTVTIFISFVESLIPTGLVKYNYNHLTDF